MKLAKVERVVEAQAPKSLKQYMEDAKNPKASQVNEGPLDFMKGAGGFAGKAVAQGAANAARRAGGAIKQGVGNVVQAGKTASATADLEKAVANLAALLTKAAEYDKMNVRSARQQPEQQQKQEEPKPQGGPSGAPDAFRSTSKPKGVAGKDGHDFQWTFNSYMQAIHGQQLDEGIFDFVKGAGKAVGNAAREKINKYAEGPSIFKDIYSAGVNASAQADAKKQLQARQQIGTNIQTAVDSIKQLAQQVGPEALMAAVRKMGGDQANAIAKLLGQEAAPQRQAAPARDPNLGTPAGPDVQAKQAELAQRRAAR